MCYCLSFFGGGLEKKIKKENDKLITGTLQQKLRHQFRFLRNCLPTPPLSQHFALSEKQVLILSQGRGRWAVSQKPKFNQFPCLGAYALGKPFSIMNNKRYPPIRQAGKINGNPQELESLPSIRKVALLPHYYNLFLQL